MDLNKNIKQDHFANYNGFNNMSKSDNHIISLKSSSKVGVCDLDSNCSSIEINISKPNDSRISNKGFSLIANQSNQSSINFKNNIDLDQNQSFFTIKGNSNDLINSINPLEPIKFTNSKESFNNLIFDNQYLFIILLIILVIYLIKKKNN